MSYYLPSAAELGSLACATSLQNVITCFQKKKKKKRDPKIMSDSLWPQATGDPYYLEAGRTIMDNLNRFARVPCGFAAMKDVRTGSHEDR